MRVAVTGATGFLGSHVTERLLADGHAVRVLARSVERAARFQGRVEEIAVGHIADPDLLGVLFRECDAAIHLVSNFRAPADPPAEFERTNVRGTIEALRVARQQGVGRFIHCSTIGVHGHVRSTPADEDSPYNPGDLYQSTKVEAERACHAEMAKGGMSITIVRPCSIYGPGDMRMLKMFRMLKKGRFLTLGACRENFHAVYVSDLVDGFMRALDADGAAGQTFIIGGPRYVPLWDYLVTAARAVGAPPPRIRLPYAPVYAASILCEAICAPLRIAPPIHRRRVRFFRNNRAFSIEKAREALGYDPVVGLDEGMRRTVSWYHQHGYL